MKRGASSSSRSVLKGYLLGLENVVVSRKKFEWFPIYVQTEREDVVSVASFDIRQRTRELIQRFVHTKAPISMTINQSDRGPTFDEGCDISPVNDNSVGFSIRACQIPVYAPAREPQEATVRDIIDLTDIKGLYNLQGVVCYGKAPLEVRTCKDGTKAKIKVDFIEDDEGNIIQLKLWEDMFVHIENQTRYRFTKVGIFDNFKTGREITPTRGSEFTLIGGDVDVPSLKGPAEISKSSTAARLDITRFMSNRNNSSFYSCLNCHEPIYVSGIVPEDLLCKQTNCGAESAVEFMEYSVSIEGLVREEGGENRWLLMREDVLSTVFDLSKIDNLAESVKRLRDLEVTYDRETGRVISLLAKSRS